MTAPLGPGAKRVPSKHTPVPHSCSPEGPLSEGIFSQIHGLRKYSLSVLLIEQELERDNLRWEKPSAFLPGPHMSAMILISDNVRTR